MDLSEIDKIALQDIFREVNPQSTDTISLQHFFGLFSPLTITTAESAVLKIPDIMDFEAFTNSFMKIIQYGNNCESMTRFIF